LLTSVLEDARISRDNTDILTNYSGKIAPKVTDVNSDARAQLIKVWNVALERLANDSTLSKADRLSAVDAKVALARLDAPQGPLAPALVQEVRERVAAADKATTDIYERQSVISNAADVLADADLLDESDVLLKAELKRSHSPYYFMTDLAINAKKRGDSKTALDWYERAYDAAKGPATRLQWGSTYLGSLLELAPDDEKRIEKTANSIISELGDTQNAFYERNRGRLETLGHKFAVWNTLGQHDAVFQKVHQQLNGVCAKLPDNDPQRAACLGVLEPAKS
jgi:hypothetical protein